MEAENARLMPMKVEIINKVVKADNDDTVQFALLGSKDHDQHVDVVFTFNAGFYKEKWHAFRPKLNTSLQALHTIESLKDERSSFKPDGFSFSGEQ